VFSQQKKTQRMWARIAEGVMEETGETAPVEDANSQEGAPWLIAQKA
jgi:hypothetical protein